MGFWGSMFGGSNPTLNSGIKESGQVAGFENSQGQGLQALSSDWLKGLLGGNTAMTTKLLAPQIATAQKQGQQAKKTMSQFGTRSGGVTSQGQTIDDKTRAGINDMVSSLTSGALQQAGAQGTSMVDAGLKALGMQVDFSQQQMENWSNSIFGQGLGTAAGYAETAGLGKL